MIEGSISPALMGFFVVIGVLMFLAYWQMK